MKEQQFCVVSSLQNTWNTHAGKNITRSIHIGAYEQMFIEHKWRLPQQQQRHRKRHSNKIERNKQHNNSNNKRVARTNTLGMLLISVWHYLWSVECYREPE